MRRRSVDFSFMVCWEVEGIVAGVRGETLPDISGGQVLVEYGVLQTVRLTVTSSSAQVISRSY